MVIDIKKYSLPENNFINCETIKKQIVIGHTSTNSMKHYTKWLNRLNGRYTKTAQYTIDINGKIYQHFDPIFTSNILKNTELDKKSIVILLENDGWLVKDFEKNEFINWYGDIYNITEPVVEKRWRGYLNWAPYTNKQFNSAVWLSNKLCDDFYIKKFAIPHNTKIENHDDFSGVLYRGNLDKDYTDLSPAWNFENFKYKLENQ
jgi:hypothetical protein